MILSITNNDSGADGARDFVAMDYVEGESLRELIMREREQINRILDLIAQAASGLAAAHQAGIFQREYTSC